MRLVKSRFLLLAAILLPALAAGLVFGWQRVRPSQVQVYELAAFEENNVRVLLELHAQAGDQALLVATYTPLEAGFHLYSKELPMNGVNGLGRPTRLDLPFGSHLVATGGLQESVAATFETVLEGSQEVPVYPPGPVTLIQPVRLPRVGGEWVEEQLSFTYMTCSPKGCTRPVTGKIVTVSIPTASQP